MAVLAVAVAFVVSLLIGTVAILAGVRLVIDSDAGFFNAALTALIGAAVWGAVSFVVEWIPLLGLVLMLVAWVGVINWRYPGGWVSATAVGFVAWIVAVAIVYALAVAGLVSAEAIGIPGI